MNPDPAPLLHRLGHTFRRPELLQLALTHPSCLQADPAAGESNQRLEFLGDAVLQLVLTDELYREFPADREGALSRRRANLSKGAFLSQLARDIGLDAALRLSPGEEQSGGRARASNLEDAFEAVIGAVFLDGGLPAAQSVVRRIYGPLPARLAGLDDADNPKGRLQEIVQPRFGNGTLDYRVIGETGAAHAREFEVTVCFKDRPLGTGRGSSKKLAEEAAARAALRQIADTLLA